ncbi:hypothetical protein VUR80DRAFT_1301 [Thermomyces stellatus]
MEPSMQQRTRQLGFAGLGAMGFGMASNLLNAGFSVHGFDVNPAALAKFAELGGSASSSVREASSGQAKFFVMVATPEQVDSLVFGPGGLCDSLPSSPIVCLFSTLPPQYVKSLKSRIANSGRNDIRLVDCPVSGGAVGARSGKLTIMIGCDGETVEEIRPELEAISAPGRLFHTGPVGSASTLKMLNQHLAGIHIVAAAETLAFAKCMGLSSRETHKILMNSNAASWIMGDRGVSMLNGDWSPKSAVSIFTKDLKIVTDAADRLLLPCPLASVAFQCFAEREASGHGRDDDASVVCNYEKLTGAKVEEPQNDPSLVPLRDSSSEDTGPGIVLIVSDGAWAEKFRKEASLSGDAEESKLRVVHAQAEDLDKALKSLPQGTFVGVTGFQDSLRRLSSQNPHLEFFDYHTEIADGYTCKVLFTAKNDTFSAMLEKALGPRFAITQVRGSLGSATAVALSMRLASLIHVTAAAECYALAAAEGVSPNLVYELIAGAAGSSAQFNKVMPRMIQGDFMPYPELGITSLDDALRDLSAIKAQIQRIKFPGRLIDTAYQIFKKVHTDMNGQTASTAALTSFWVSRGSIGSKLA